VNREYIRSIWTNRDETDAQVCLEGAYTNEGFRVKNFHMDDRPNEKGRDIQCTKEGIEDIAFAVKKKPRKEDIQQLIDFATLNPNIMKFYVYLSPPTAPFESEMRKWEEVKYLDWVQLHEMLVTKSSIKYVGLYFSAHPLIFNFNEILKTLYDCRGVDFQNTRATRIAKAMLWSIKDDAVKLKATLEFINKSLGQELMDKLELNPGEYLACIDRIHHELDIANSIAGVKLCSSFMTMKRKFPNLLGLYWDTVSHRSDWKNFTSRAVEIGKSSDTAVNSFILNEWIIPSSELDSRNSLYANTARLLEHLFLLAKDIEEGIDWLFEDTVLVDQP